MNSTKFSVEGVFVDIIGKEGISTEQITKLNNFFSQHDVNININMNLIFLELERKIMMNYKATAPTEYDFYYLYAQECLCRR